MSDRYPPPKAPEPADPIEFVMPRRVLADPLPESKLEGDSSETDFYDDNDTPPFDPD